jgi:hypothetical protein
MHSDIERAGERGSHGGSWRRRGQHESPVLASGRRQILSPSYPRRLAISLRVEICFETLDLKEAKALLGTLTL